MTGQTLAHYEILEKLGEGGMGIVYKARDTHLDRFVAIKVLPPEKVSNPDRKARFVQEAKSASALNHPNIVTIFDIAAENGIDFMAMEFVAGKTLDELIQRKGMRLGEALKVAVQVADALAAAHEAGIIHRDLKPGNIMVGDDGRVRVLDFGLAKLTEAVPESDETRTVVAGEVPQTEEGTILGTASYMSPEQAEGKTLDARSDIFSFGAIVYELLTGQRAFDGESTVSRLAAILNQKPRPMAEFIGPVPRDVEKLVDRCLRKDRTRRCQTAADLKVSLEELIEDTGPDAPLAGPAHPAGGAKLASPAAASDAPPGARRKPRIVPTAIIAALASVLTGVVVWWLQPADGIWADETTHLSVGVEPVEEIGTWNVRERPSPSGALITRFIGGRAPLTRTALAVTPDGRQLVVAGRSGEQHGLYLRSFGEDRARFIPGTENGMNPFLSPDGEWVAFWADGELKRVRLDGGPAIPICDADYLFGAHWGSDGNIVFGQATGGLLKVPEEGGPSRLLTQPNAANAGESHRLPWVLPGGEEVLFTVFDGWRGSWDDARIVGQILASGERKTLITGGSQPVYLPTGHLLYAKGGALWAVAFDASELKIRGGAVLVVDDVTQAAGISNVFQNTGAAQFSVSPAGTLVYLDGGLLPTEPRSLVWMDESGNRERLDVPPGEYWTPRISPDGTRVAVSDQQQRVLIVYDLSRGIFQRLRGGGFNVGAWSPDGTRIVFGWTEGDARNLHWQLADGSEPPQRLDTSPNLQFAGAWTREGSELIFVERHPRRGNDILRLRPMEMNGKSESLLRETFNEEYPTISPDGRRLAYASDESEQFEIYVRSYPSLGGKRIVSRDGGIAPAWSADGSTLYYLRLHGGLSTEVAVLAVKIDSDQPTARELFRGPFQTSRYLRSYDVAADGRLLMVELPDHGTSGPDRSVRVVLNWLEELRKLVPSR